MLLPDGGTAAANADLVRIAAAALRSPGGPVLDSAGYRQSVLA